MSSPRRGAILAALLLGLLAVALGPATPSAPAASTPIGVGAPPVAGSGRVIVKMRPGRAAAALRAGAASYGATEIEERPAIDAQVWQVHAGSEGAVAARLAERPDVEYAEPDALRHLNAVPNDALYAAYQWNMPKIGAPQAWDITTGDPSVKIAVIDSGFDVLHPDAPAHLQLGCDYVRWRLAGLEGACPTVSDDQNGHGTHVGGIVAARQNNQVGISGLAPNATLLSIRTADETGSSLASDIASAIREATDGGARVINLSLGGPSSTQTEQIAVNYAVARGVVVVAAAGNEYGQGNRRSYPASLPGVLAVGSASNDDQHAYFSNTGSYVSLVAPGGSAPNNSDPNVLHWIASLYPVSKGGYQLIEGTSQASPHVAAVAGLMLSVRPSLTGSQVASLLKATARPLGAPIPNDTFGYGYLDAQAAVKAAQALGGVTALPSSTSTSTPMPTPMPTTTPTPTPMPTMTSTPTPTPSPTSTVSRCPTAEARSQPIPTVAADRTRAFLPLNIRGCGA